MEQNLVRLFMLGVLLGMVLAVGTLNELWWVQVGAGALGLIITTRAYFLCREISARSVRRR